MKIFVIIFGIVIIGCLMAERAFALRHRRAIKHVIHVNGTRGKSGVTRLIAAGLREGGLRVYCKTTGTLPMTIDCQGVEREIHRRGPANISEQIKILRAAAADRAQVLVIECMAVNPELQYTCEHRILHSDIGVITNARIDHVAEMGADIDSVRYALANTIPESGVLFTSDAWAIPVWEKIAARQHSSLILSHDLPEGLTMEEAGNPDFPENIALALAVCERLGVSGQDALRGFAKVQDDPYTLSVHKLCHGTVTFIDAMSANDPESTAAIIERYAGAATGGTGHEAAPRSFIYILNTRSDRGYRTKLMLDMLRLSLPRAVKPSQVWVLGTSRPIALRYLWKYGIPAAGYKNPADLPVFRWAEEEAETFAPAPAPELAPATELAPAPGSEPPAPTIIFAIGNIAGPGMKLMELIKSREEEERCTEKS